MVCTISGQYPCLWLVAYFRYHWRVVAQCNPVRSVGLINWTCCCSLGPSLNRSGLFGCNLVMLPVWVFSQSRTLFLVLCLVFWLSFVLLKCKHTIQCQIIGTSSGDCNHGILLWSPVVKHQEKGSQKHAPEIQSTVFSCTWTNCKMRTDISSNQPRLFLPWPLLMFWNSLKEASPCWTNSELCTLAMRLAEDFVKVLSRE